MFEFRDIFNVLEEKRHERNLNFLHHESCELIELKRPRTKNRLIKISSKISVEKVKSEAARQKI